MLQSQHFNLLMQSRADNVYGGPGDPKKKRNSIANLRNPGKLADLRSRGSGVMFMINLNKRAAQKLRSILLLHFGLVTFRFHFRKTRKPFIFMIVGPGGHDYDSENKHCSSLDTPRDSK